MSRDTTPCTVGDRSRDDERAPAAVVNAVYRRMSMAAGELRLPVHPRYLGGDLALVERWLQAIGHVLAEGTRERWESGIREQLATAYADPEDGERPVLHFAFEPRPGSGQGLSAGSRYKLSLSPEEAAAPHEDDTGVLVRGQLEGHLFLPCAPALHEHAVALLRKLQTSLEGAADERRLGEWRERIALASEHEFAQAAEARLHVLYTNDAAGTLDIVVHPQSESIHSHYQGWLEEREGPLFGAHADAGVLDFARERIAPDAGPVLDVGAGTGRNALALAELGFDVHALDLVPGFVQRLQAGAVERGVAVRALTGDLLDEALELPSSGYAWIVASQVVSHLRKVEDVQRFLARAAAVLRPGGWLLCNGFLAEDDYCPDPAVRELSQMAWSFVMTRKELRRAIAELPLALTEDVSYLDYERAHLPASAWPPTPWFESWATGRNVLPTEAPPPFEMRWLTLRRTD